MQPLQKSFCLITFEAILNHYYYYLYILSVKLIHTRPIKIRDIRLQLCAQNEFSGLCVTPNKIQIYEGREKISIQSEKLSERKKVLSDAKWKLGLGGRTL